FLDKQDVRIAMLGAGGRGESPRFYGDGCIHARRTLAEILTNLECPERDVPVCMRLDEIAARVEHDIPIAGLFGMLVEVVREQYLREVLVRELCFAGQFETPRAGGVHDLARVGGIFAAAARAVIG